MKLIISSATALFILVSLVATGQTMAKDSGSTKKTFVIRSNKLNDLNNKIFSIKLIQTKGKKGQRRWSWESDEIAFHNKKLVLKYMKTMEQYPAVAYTVGADTSSDGNTIKFKAITRSPYYNKATITIEGTISGNDIKGTAIWVSKVGTYEYTFAGVLEK
jgi:hypothetical protein